jgi:hypothetical protein
VPVDWEAIRLGEESVDRFNDELNGLINEELRCIDENGSQKWTVRANAFQKPSKRQPEQLPHQMARRRDRHGSKCPKQQS